MDNGDSDADEQRTLRKDSSTYHFKENRKVSVSQPSITASPAVNRLIQMGSILTSGEDPKPFSQDIGITSAPALGYLPVTSS